VDFEKAFDLVHRKSLWSIMRSYGIPNKMVRVAIDRVMRKVTEDKKRGIRWNFTTVLEDLDFGDDFALLSSKFSDLRENIRR